MQQETPMHVWQTHALEGITLARGQGCTVWDTSGKAYLDLLSSTWCNILGYGHPRWVAAVQEQVAGLVHTSAQFPALEIEAALSQL